MSIYIVRVAPVTENLAGTVERPGGDTRPFQDSEGLIRILSDWEAGDPKVDPAPVPRSSTPAEGAREGGQ